VEPTEATVMAGNGPGARNGGKANFDDLYYQPDPRGYYHGLGGLGYEVPQHGQRVFDRALGALDIERPTLVDLCCSYGVNAALMKHDLDLDDLYRHYCGDHIRDLRPERLADVDRAFFAQHRRADAPRVAGIDVAAPAVDYAVKVGLLDIGFAENLEDDDPSPELGDVIAQTDLITVTGGVGYITERTFDRLLGCVTRRERPWVASLCLRTVSYQPVADSLARHGLVTEHLDDVTFPQRRFAHDDERDFALAELSALGVDPTGKESEGSYHVDVFLSRPREAIQDASIVTVLAGLSPPESASARLARSGDDLSV
jgi:hypothetical protein